jgi:hypothetical protein
MPKTKPDAMLADDSRWFTKRQSASFLGISSTQFTRAIEPMLRPEFIDRGGPRNRYYGPAIVDARIIQASRPSGYKRGDDPAERDELLTGKASPALERYREEMAWIRRIERLEKQKHLIPRQAIHELMTRLATRLRGALTRWRVNAGEAAYADFAETLQDFGKDVDRFCGATDADAAGG